MTIDNLDITNDYDAAHSSTGHAVNDANDTFNVSLIVLDHTKPSFTTGPYSDHLANTRFRQCGLRR